MLKTIVVFLAVAVIGGFLYWVLSPLLLPMIGSANPQISTLPDIYSTVQTRVLPFLSDNWKIITTAFTTFGIVGFISNKLHNIGVDKIKTGFTEELSKTRDYGIQEASKNLELTTKYEGLKQNYDTLVTNSKNVAEVTEKL